MEGESALTLAAMGGPGLGILGYAGALGVGIVFVGAAIAKLRHTELLAGIVANYRLLPKPLVGPVAAALPLVELITGMGLSIGLAYRVAPLGMALLGVFAGAMAINITRGRRQIDCGCGRSDLRQPLSWILVFRNLVLAALLLPSLGSGPHFPLPGIDLLVSLAGGLAIYLIYLLFNAIGALAASPLAVQRR